MKLEAWEDVESVSNQALNDIEKFRTGRITAEEITRLKKSLAEVHEEADGEQREAASEMRTLRKEAKLIEKMCIRDSCITEALIQAVKGDAENGLLFCGADAWKAERMETVQEVIDDLV